MTNLNPPQKRERKNPKKKQISDFLKNQGEALGAQGAATNTTPLRNKPKRQPKARESSNGDTVLPLITKGISSGSTPGRHSSSGPSE